MLAVYRDDRNMDAVLLGLTVWIPFVILLCGRIADDQAAFAWLEFLLLSLVAQGFPILIWCVYRRVQELF